MELGMILEKVFQQILALVFFAVSLLLHSLPTGGLLSHGVSRFSLFSIMNLNQEALFWRTNYNSETSPPHPANFKKLIAKQKKSSLLKTRFPHPSLQPQ
jgi:hypothetical protein